MYEIILYDTEDGGCPVLRETYSKPLEKETGKEI